MILVTNTNMVHWKRFIARWFFGLARFRHLNHRDIKQLSQKGGGGSRAPQDPPFCYAPVAYASSYFYPPFFSGRARLTLPMSVLADALLTFFFQISVIYKRQRGGSFRKSLIGVTGPRSLALNKYVTCARLSVSEDEQPGEQQKSERAKNCGKKEGRRRCKRVSHAARHVCSTLRERERELDVRVDVNC